MPGDVIERNRAQTNTLLIYVENCLYGRISGFSGVFPASGSGSKKVAILFNILDHPSPRKIHRMPTPLTGGIALYLSILATVISGLIAGRLLPDFFSSYYSGISSVLLKLTIFLTTSAVVVIAGFLDDIYHFKPLVKLGFQILCGIITFLAGIKISLFSSGMFVHLLLTAGWIVICMNSFNLLDHTNGLAAGVAFIAGGIFFFAAAINGQLFIATLLVCFYRRCSWLFEIQLSCRKDIFRRMRKQLSRIFSGLSCHHGYILQISTATEFSSCAESTAHIFCTVF